MEEWVQSFEHRRSKPPSEPAPSEPPAALQVHQRPDGVLDIDVVQRGPGHWRVVPAQAKPSGRFSVADLTNQGLDEGVSYVKRNAFELVLLGHALIQKVARGIFLLFMTLMVAGYIMQTREAIVGFFRSLLPARSRIGFDRLLVRLDEACPGWCGVSC